MLAVLTTDDWQWLCIILVALVAGIAFVRVN